MSHQKIDWNQFGPISSGPLGEKNSKSGFNFNLSHFSQKGPPENVQNWFQSIFRLPRSPALQISSSKISCSPAPQLFCLPSMLPCPLAHQFSSSPAPQISSSPALLLTIHAPQLASPAPSPPDIGGTLGLFQAAASIKEESCGWRASQSATHSKRARTRWDGWGLLGGLEHSGWWVGFLKRGTLSHRTLVGFDFQILSSPEIF